MKPLVIIGAGDTGREVVGMITRINEEKKEWELLGFLDDNCQKEVVAGYPVLGNVDWLENHKDVYVVCSVATSQIKKKIIQRSDRYGVHYATIIDPAAILLPGATVGEGSIICAGDVLAINNRVGRHVYVSLGCTLGHDDIIEDFCSIYPGVNISGKVHLHECVDVGTGTKIIQGKTICENVTLGAGSVVIKDIAEPGTYVGVPARMIIKHTLNKR